LPSQALPRENSFGSVHEVLHRESSSGSANDMQVLSPQPNPSVWQRQRRYSAPCIQYNGDFHLVSPSDQMIALLAACAAPGSEFDRTLVPCEPELIAEMLKRSAPEQYED
jgi:hypothetical protein